MSDGRGPQLHQFGDRRLSSLSRQNSRMSGSFEPRSRLSAIALTPASVRRKSGYQASSQSRTSFGYVGSNVGGTTPILLRGSTGPRSTALNSLVLQLRLDTRNSRNRVYMELLLKEVYDFCLANNFEAEMGHHIALTTFDTPTQKDFVFLFKFLYGKLDPNFRFLALFDSDMKAILKNLSYPGLDKLRDASSAAGEQNWHYYLAMLYWLVKLNLMLLSANDENTFNAPSRAFEKIYNPCVFSSYASFIDRVDDYEESDQVMEKEFNEYKDEIYKAEQEKQASIEALLEEKELLSVEYKRVDEAEDMTGRLKTDIGSLNKYLENLHDGFALLNSNAVEYDSVIDKLEQRITEVLRDKEKYNNTLRSKGFDIEQLAKLEENQAKMTKVIESVSVKLKATKVRLFSTEDSLYNSSQSLHDSVSRYNLTLRQIPALTGADDITINVQITEDSSRLFGVESILNRPLKEEKEVLNRMDAQIKEDRLATDEDYLQTLQHIEEYKQTLTEHGDRIDILESTLAKNKTTLEDLHAQTTLEALRLYAEIEKMDKDLQAMKTDMTLETLKAKTQNTNLKRELMETRYLIKDKRETLLRTVQSDLNYVISFKDHIQKTLETLRLQTVKELENEQRRETGNLR